MILSSSNQEVTTTPPPINKHYGCVCREHIDSFEAYYFKYIVSSSRKQIHDRHCSSPIDSNN